MTITLATLESATAQQVFDQVANHLLTQNRKCVGEAEPSGALQCQYRAIASDGTVLKCAAGALIADDEYKPNFETHTWVDLSGNFSEVPSAHDRLIHSLQMIHDGRVPSEWPIELKLLAEQEGLEIPELLAQRLPERAPYDRRCGFQSN